MQSVHGVPPSLFIKIYFLLCGLTNKAFVLDIFFCNGVNKTI